MTALSPKVVEEFCKLCGWAHEAWATHRAAFDDNPNIESICRIGRNEAFLGRLSIITQEYALHQLVKLHDPAVQQNRCNLTLEYIVNYGGWDTATSSTLSDLKKQLDALALKIKPARNRILSHNDLKSIVAGTALGQFDKDADRDYFRVLQEFVNIVHGKTIGGAYDFGQFAKDDAQLFMEALPRG